MINNKSKVKWPITYTIRLYKIKKKSKYSNTNTNTKMNQIHNQILEIQWMENKYSFNFFTSN
jgi:hypothetical protein